MRIKVLQTQRKASIQEALKYIVKLVAQACQEPQDFIVLPEHALIQPECGLDEDTAIKIQETFSSLALKYNTYILTGSWLEVQGSHTVNITRLLDRKGRCLASVKHAFDMKENTEERYPVIETDMGKVGILLGSDFWNIESSRIQTLQGAELVLVSGNLTTKNLNSKQCSIWGIATLNCIAIAYASTGTSVDTKDESAGGSMIALPSNIQAKAEWNPEVIQAMWDDGLMSKTREADLTFKNTLWFGLWARRKELYAPLSMAEDLSNLAPTNVEEW
ncbi:carbon-nitrogen hydrolase family protein [Shewanella woodyi]|uniref:carbon-nitrogen hydrolase family protein n=1 Tax=Shewanella woodyi TaxID=60961 RepID=UPI0037498D95